MDIVRSTKRMHVLGAITEYQSVIIRGVEYLFPNIQFPCWFLLCRWFFFYVGVLRNRIFSRKKKECFPKITVEPGEHDSIDFHISTSTLIFIIFINIRARKQDIYSHLHELFWKKKLFYFQSSKLKTDLIEANRWQWKKTLTKNLFLAGIKIKLIYTKLTVR